MISSIKSKKKIFCIFCLGLPWIFSTDSYAAPDFRHQDLSNFAVVSGDDWAISIPKKSSNHDVVMIRGNQILSITGKGDKKTFSLQQVSQEYKFELYANSISKIGLILTEQKIQENSQACPAPIQEPVERLLQNDLSEKIQDLAISEGFIDESCDSIVGAANIQILKLFKKELNPKTSFIMECLNSPDLQKQLSKNPQFGSIANQVVAAYTKDADDISKSSSNLKLMCHEGKKATYDPKKTAISIPVADGNITADVCKSVSQVFAHEQLHHLGLGEPDAEIFDSVCGNILKVPGTQKKDCKNVYSSKLKTDSGPATTRAIQATQSVKTKAAQKEITEQLVKSDIKVADFKPVQDADIKEITNPTSGGAYQASVDRVYNTMSSNMEKMAAPLNRAIASTVTTARAERTKSTTTSERSISKTTIAGLRQPASANSNGNEEYVVEEILADKYNVPVSEVRAAAVAADASAPGSVASQTVATRSAARTPANTTAPAGGNEIAGSNAGPSGGQVATASTGGSSAGGGVPGRSVSGGARGNSRLPASAGGNTVGSDPLVEQLGQFNEVRGQRYRQLTERYDDPSFEPELRAKNIAIEYRRNNKTTIIGETSNSRTLFRDDGTVLKKISGAK